MHINKIDQNGIFVSLIECFAVPLFLTHWCLGGMISSDKKKLTDKNKDICPELF